MIKRYKTKGNGVEFDLIFHDALTIITGESGSGRTFLFKILRNDSIIGLLDAICLNYEDIPSGIIDITLNSAKNKLIIIDNANIILTPEQMFNISIDNSNQYIMFVHSIQGIHPTERSIAKLKIKNNKGTLEYTLL